MASLLWPYFTYVLGLKPMLIFCKIRLKNNKIANKAIRIPACRCFNFVIFETNLNFILFIKTSWFLNKKYDKLTLRHKKLWSWNRVQYIVVLKQMMIYKNRKQSHPIMPRCFYREAHKQGILACRCPELMCFCKTSRRDRPMNKPLLFSIRSSQNHRETFREQSSYSRLLWVAFFLIPRALNYTCRDERRMGTVMAVVLLLLHYGFDNIHIGW